MTRRGKVKRQLFDKETMPKFDDIRDPIEKIKARIEYLRTSTVNLVFCASGDPLRWPRSWVIDNPKEEMAWCQATAKIKSDGRYDGDKYIIGHCEIQKYWRPKPREKGTAKTFTRYIVKMPDGKYVDTSGYQVPGVGNAMLCSLAVAVKWARKIDAMVDRVTVTAGEDITTPTSTNLRGFIADCLRQSSEIHVKIEPANEAPVDLAIKQIANKI